MREYVNNDEWIMTVLKSNATINAFSMISFHWNLKNL